MPRRLIIDPAQLALDPPLVSRDDIRRVNPQRYEMEQLTAIVHIDPKAHVIAGYKDVGQDEFWVRGHMPDYPLMPGVLMCEAAAQLCSYYVTTQRLLGGDFVAFGGMEHVKFRGAVRPGDRLILAARATQIRPGRIAVFACQGLVNQAVVFQAEIDGLPFSKQSERRPSRTAEREVRGVS